VVRKLAEKGLKLEPGALTAVDTRQSSAPKRHRPGATRALSRRDRGDLARLPYLGPCSVAHRPRAAIAARCQRHRVR
jgi:hypothetical protein